MYRESCRALVASVLAVVLVFSSAGVIRAEDSNGDCYWSFAESVGFGCSEADLQMLALKQRAASYQLAHDSYEYWGTVIEMQMLEKEHKDTLHVSSMTPMTRNEVIDFAYVGDNVRYATVPGPWGDVGRRLMVYDKLGRPVKMHHTCTSEGEWWINTTLSFLWGYFAGSGQGLKAAVELVSGGAVVLTDGASAFGQGAIMSIAQSWAAAVPDSGDCIILVDILGKPDSNGDRHVYRNQVRINEAGTIDVRKWPSEQSWKDIGIVYYDENGQPVW